MPPLVPAPTQETRITQVQRLLSALGYDPGFADGIWGPQTAAALHAFQQDAGFPVSDVISDELIAHAQSVLKDRRTSSR